MADKNIQMTQRNAANNGWDNLFPITKVENVSGAAKKQQEDWIPIVLENGWKAFNGTGYPNGYYKNEVGDVKFRGMLIGGGIDTVAFTLPEGYRPHSDQFFILISDNSSTSNPAMVLGRAGVKSNGQVVLISGGSKYVSLSNVVFKADK